MIEVRITRTNPSFSKLINLLTNSSMRFIYLLKYENS